MKKIEVINNFLKREEFMNLNSLLEDPYFPWFYNKDKDKKEKAHLITQFQFTHAFFNGSDKSKYYNIILPLINEVNPKFLLRAKINLNPYSQKIVLGEFHTDNTIKQAVTAIYYVNSNNGYTLIKTKNNIERIESVGNRLVMFESSLLHAGTNSTDCKNRMVINLNYIKE